MPTKVGQYLLVGFGAALVGALAVFLAVDSGKAPLAGGTERARIERVVHDYILEHPEIIPQAMQALEARENARLADANRAALEKPFASAWAGAAEPTATLVVFYDYACGFCRSSLPDIERLLREDRQLRVVFRELPILSPESEAAARVSLAAAQAGKFKPFHDALWAAGRPSAATIETARAKAGLDPAAAAGAGRSTAYAREIDANIALARSLRFTGTPGWVVGDKVINGAVGYAALKAAIADARKG